MQITLQKFSSLSSTCVLFFASYFCKCWTRGSTLLVVGSLLFIGRQSLVALNFTDKMEFLYSCLRPKVYLYHANAYCINLRHI